MIGLLTGFMSAAKTTCCVVRTLEYCASRDLLTQCRNMTRAHVHVRSPYVYRDDKKLLMLDSASADTSGRAIHGSRRDVQRESYRRVSLRFRICHCCRDMVDCPICRKPVKEKDINDHIDSGCSSYILEPALVAPKSNNVSSFFQTPSERRASSTTTKTGASHSQSTTVTLSPTADLQSHPVSPKALKRPSEHEVINPKSGGAEEDVARASKRTKLNALQNVAPLAERMRPRTLDEVCGQELVGPSGVIRGLVEQDRVPSMILWGGPGTGKTTIARLIANTAGCRFVEINSTSSGVGECKKLFGEARSELSLTGRKTIIFCDEIHRFNKSQQDVFLGPVEAGLITLIGGEWNDNSFETAKSPSSK